MMKLQQLNNAQQQAVTAPLGPVLVLAGAGSGKTRVLTNRIVYLVNNCEVKPRNILAITFTNKAALEMKHRLLEWDCDAQYMTISTIHSFCAMVLRNEAVKLNRHNNFTIYADDDKKSLLKKVVNNIVEDKDSNLVEDIASTISHLKNNATDLSAISNNGLDSLFDGASDDSALLNSLYVCSKHIDNVGEDKIGKIITDYQNQMTVNNAMDFDDLLYYTHKLFSTSKEVLEYYQQKYTHILIDEFQDTNKVQYEIFRLLASKYYNIFVVGDDDQSIYSWRGADVGNILNFNQHFPNALVFKLEQNYRSTKRILDVANLIISKNTNRFDKVLFTDNEDGVKVEQFAAYNEQDEAYYVVQQIANLRYNNKYQYKDCAILMRINALSRSFEQQLNRAGIAYRVFGGFKFFDRKEVKDVLSYLRLVDNKYDNQSFIRSINVPYRRGIGDTTVSKLLELSMQMCLPIIDIIGDSDNLEGIVSKTTIAKLTEYYRLYVDFCQYSITHSVDGLLNYVIDKTLFRQYYMDMDDTDRAINIDELQQAVVDYVISSQEHASLSNFLQNVALAVDREDDEDGSDFVTVGTIHAVKGLEFKAVFVVGLEEGIFPISRSTFSAKDLQEERRLMYVAATRARQRLYLSYAQSRFVYGRRNANLASSYYGEVVKHLRPKPIINEYRLNDDNYLDMLNRKSSRIAVDTPSQPAVNMSLYKIGQKVTHNTFGHGMIININGTKVDIIFDKFGKKCLDFCIAKISIEG